MVNSNFTLFFDINSDGVYAQYLHSIVFFVEPEEAKDGSIYKEMFPGAPPLPLLRADAAAAGCCACCPRCASCCVLAQCVITTRWHGLRFHLCTQALPHKRASFLTNYLLTCARWVTCVRSE